MYRLLLFYLFTLGLSIYSGFIHWLEVHMLSCPSKKYFHIECPGCGLQRSVVALLKGDFIASFALYPATLPIVFMFIFTILHLKYSLKNGASIIKYSQVGITIVIALFYIYKIINHKIIA